MKRAERIIRQQINDLTMDGIAYKRKDIEQAIKFMYWQGVFRKKKFEVMNTLLLDKYYDIMNKHEIEVHEDMERDFQNLRKQYGIQ